MKNNKGGEKHDSLCSGWRHDIDVLEQDLSKQFRKDLGME